MNNKIDLQTMAYKLDFDLEDVEMLVEVFLSEAKKNLVDLKNAIDTNNLEDIFRYAHSIKGSASNLTLQEISNTAKEIEDNARKNATFDYKTSFEILKQLIDNIK